MKRRRTVVFGLAALVFALGAAVAGARVATPSAKQADPIIIGAAIAKTGFVNFFDDPMSAGAELAVKDFNAAGGLLGRPLKIVYSDTKSDLNQIQQSALEVIGKGASFVLTSCDYDFGGPAARVAGSKGLIGIGCAGGPLYGRQGVGPLAFNVYQATPTEGATMASWAYNAKKWRTAYAMCDTSVEYSKTVCSYFKESWKKLGGKLAGEDTFVNSDPSISAQITKAKSAKYDFMVLASYAPGGPSALRQIRGAGISAPIIGAGAFDGTYWFPAVPNKGEFFYPAPATKWGSPVRNPLVARLVKAYGKQPPSYLYPVSGYEAIEILVTAAKRAKSLKGTAVAAQIEKFKNEPLVMGPTTYTPSCHIPLGRPMAMMKVINNHDVYLGVHKLPSQSILPKSPC